MFTKKMGNETSAIVWAKTYNEIKNKHDQAFQAIEQAISLEEGEKPNEAIEKYKKGIEFIDETLNVQVICPEKPDDTWDKACSMIQKIKKTRAEVLTRINAIQSSPNFVPDSLPEQPPSYEESVTSSDEEFPRTYKDLAEALNDLSFDPNQNMEENIVYTHDGVQLYFISPNGEVLSTQEPQVLKISLVEGNEPNAPRAILQIGDYLYPLVPGVSPCYRTNYGAFILPDVHSNVLGSSIGIILPTDADEEVFDLLENILHGIISEVSTETIQDWQRHRREDAGLEDYSTRISNKIVDGALYVSQGLINGAQKAGHLFTRATPKIIEKIPAAERPTEVSPRLSKGIEIAETATNKAAKVTGFVAEKVGIATLRLGQYLAPHIQKQGTRLLANGFNMPEKEASDRMKGILTVAAGAVEGFSTVYRGLETSAAILGGSLKENTVKIVEHKYGYPASNLTDNTLSTVGNVYNIAQNSKMFTPKGLIKRTAKDTGKSMIYTASTLNNEIAGSSSQARIEELPESDDDGSLKSNNLAKKN